MIQDMLKEKVSSMRSASSDDLLAALGLERRRSPIEIGATTAGVLVVGMAIGAGIALLMAPKSGRALRQDLRARATELRDRVGEKADDAARELKSAFSPEERAQNTKREENSPNAHRRA